MFCITGLFAQTEKEFKPYGKPVFVTFTNVHYSFNEEGGNPLFEISRVYLGYEHFFSETFSSRAVFDVGDPGVGGLKMTAYVKNALIQYKQKNFSGRIGLISTDAFNLVEKQWGNRYIFKTFQDENGFNSSADLGAAIEYTPSEYISFDASVLNGEGYKKLQSDSIFKYTAGITLHLVDGLQLRAYTDFMKKDYLQNTMSFFGGYTNNRLSLGLEYAIQSNNKMINDNDYSGFSAFGTFKVNDKFGLLARYDFLKSEKAAPGTDPWNFNNDGQIIIAGLDYSPVRGIRIAPVYIGRIPADNTKPFTSAPGLYFEIKL